MSSDLDRNPSPPPGILSNEDFLPDRIADTVYSKRWTLKLLMNIVEAASETDVDNSTDVEKHIVELDSAIEEDACTLWDMSATKAVAEYLVQCGVLEIFLSIIHKTKSPRLLEIIIGILGNICTFKELCVKLSENDNFRNTVLYLSGTTDTPSLIQLFRLITCGIKYQMSEYLWVNSFDNKPFFMENVRDILLNTLNCNLIQVIFQFLFDYILRDLTACNIWNQDQYLTAVIISGQQLLEKNECLDNFFCVFNAIISDESPSVIKAVVDQWLELKPLFKEYVDALSKEENLFDSTRYPALHSYFSLYTSLLKDPNMKIDMVSDMNMLSSCAKVLASVNLLITNMKKKNNSTSVQSPEDKNSSWQGPEQRNGHQENAVRNPDVWENVADTIIEAAEAHQKFTNEEDGSEILKRMVKSSSIVQLQEQVS